MYQFYTAEIIKTQSGDFEHDIKWHWDEDEYKAQLKGEAKFHEILSRAAVSDNAEHAAILFSSRGNRIMDKCYYHTIETTPEEPENPEEPTEEVIGE